jgi:phenylalanyl-tRNA synthetase beta chain
MQYSELEAFILSIAPQELVRCSAIDIYTHESFGERMSLTLKLQFQSNEKTLEEENIALMIESLLGALSQQFGISLR